MTQMKPIRKDGMDCISVCVCTFKRPDLLLRTLTALGKQVTHGQLTFHIVVADNDGQRSAEAAVADFASISAVPVTYVCEPRQNIALARNRAIACVEGEFFAFIDDDEAPGIDWLWHLLEALKRSGADGVLAPVEPDFGIDTPSWVKKGGFYDRANHATGYRLSWPECRTGNVLLRRAILNPGEDPFRAEFGSGGEDTDFFRRMVERGHTFVWCREAPVYELIPPARCRRGFLLKRALLRGSSFRKHSGNRSKHIVKSLIAAPAYVAALPFLLFCGQHLFLKYFFKASEHIARLLSVSGVSLVNTRET